jgi:RNA polymerase sigma factor (sigma-70 family)
MHILRYKSGEGGTQAGSASSVPALQEPDLGETRPADTPQINTWTDLVNRVRAGDPAGMEELYRVFSRGVRFFLCRQLGPQELDDKVHDTFVIVVQAIQRGDLRDPERLMGFVRTVVRRQIAAHIEKMVHDRREQIELDFGVTVADTGSDPEQRLIAGQRRDLMSRVLKGINRRDREILTRFYLMEQSQQQICEDMHLTETQFRLLKSRAKTRFGELGKRKLGRTLRVRQPLTMPDPRAHFAGMLAS